MNRQPSAGVLVLKYGDTRCCTNYVSTSQFPADCQPSTIALPNTLSADPNWQQVRAQTEASGPIVAQVLNTFMRLTPYSPQQPQIRSNVQELSIYDAMPGKLSALHDRFAKHTMGLFSKYGIDNIAYWVDDVGTSNRLTYMLGYPDLGAREKSWAA